METPAARAMAFDTRSGRQSWTLVDQFGLPIAAVEDFLSYLRALGKFRNTVEAYARHLSLLWRWPPLSASARTECPMRWSSARPRAHDYRRKRSSAVLNDGKQVACPGTPPASVILRGDLPVSQSSLHGPIHLLLRSVLGGTNDPPNDEERDREDDHNNQQADEESRPAK